MSAVGKRIDQVIAAGLAPLLRAQGFGKEGRDFRRTDEQSIAVINVQASLANTGDRARFTLNVGRYFPAVAEIEGRLSAAAAPAESECTVRRRIGELMPGGQDHWWEIAADSDTGELAAQVTQSVAQHVLPWLEQIRTLDALNGELRSQPALAAASVALLLGDKAEAVRRATALREQRPMAKARINAWARRNGVVLS